MNIQPKQSAVASEQAGTGLDSLDLMILTEMETNGRMTMSDLANRVGISRPYAQRRFQSLVDRKITTIMAVTNPLALGFRTFAVTGIRVLPDSLQAVASRLSSIPNVVHLAVTAGWADIAIYVMFADPSDVPRFTTSQLGNIPGITSAETMIVLDWWMSYSSLSPSQWRHMSFSPPTRSDPAKRDSGWEQRLGPAAPGGQDSDLSIDRLDLLILAQLERDGRQTVSELARKLRIDRGNAGSRLKRLLDKQITWVTALTNPFELGYHIFAMIGLKVSPRESDAVASKLRSAPHVYWVAKVAGRHDVIIWANFIHPADLSHLLSTEVGLIPGVLSTETMIGLELKKMSFGYLASSYLRSVEQSQ